MGILDRIEYWLLVALAVAAFLWRNHRRAARRAEIRGEAPPSMEAATWPLLPPLLAFGIGVIAGFLYLMFAFKPGEGWGGIVYFVGAVVVGILAMGASWLLLAALGPMVQLCVAAGLAVVYLSVWGLQAVHTRSQQAKDTQAPTSRQVAASATPVAEENRKWQGIDHAGEGVVPARLLEVASLGETQRVGNRTGQALFVNVSKVRRRSDGSGYDRCQLAVERREKGGGSLPRISLEFKPELAPGASVPFTADCGDRYVDAPLEFRVYSVEGKTLFMSDTAF